MQSEQHPIRDVSDTALWTAAYRAEESARPDALFRDPYAAALAGERGREIAVRAASPAVRTGVVLRTALIDRVVLEAVRHRGRRTVLNLAAGLDARPYRLDLPAGTRWIEADLPRIIDYKESVLAGMVPPGAAQVSTGQVSTGQGGTGQGGTAQVSTAQGGVVVTRERVDLTDPAARRALLAGVADDGHPILVLTEGLLGYLAAEDVAALARDLHAAPGVAEWITDLLGDGLASRVRTAGDGLKADGSTTRFAPPEGTAFFRPYGWAEAEYRSLFLEAPALGRDSLAGRAVRGLRHVMPRRARERFDRAAGVVRLTRSAG